MSDRQALILICSVYSASAPSRRKRSKRQIEDEVRDQHGGSWKRYLEQEWREDKRSTPDHELHLLHERWFSATVADWVSKMSSVDQSYTLFRHAVADQLRWFLFEDYIQCNILDIPTEGYFAAWADLSYTIETAAQLTLIGNLGDLTTFQESHVLFRNSGNVQASLNMEAFATLSFNVGQVELIGMYFTVK